MDQTDAAFVDVIHSNGENLILGGLGSSQPMGHVDFYPNGGRMQKGCSHLFVGAVSDIIWCKNLFVFCVITLLSFASQMFWIHVRKFWMAKTFMGMFPIFFIVS